MTPDGIITSLALPERAEDRLAIARRLPPARVPLRRRRRGRHPGRGLARAPGGRGASAPAALAPSSTRRRGEPCDGRRGAPGRAAAAVAARLDPPVPGPVSLAGGLYAALSLAEVVLGTLSPWPLKAVIDNVLGRAAVAARGCQAGARRWSPAAPSDCSLLSSPRGLALQIVNQVVSAFHTQVMVDTGQRMVLDLRQRLFATAAVPALAPPRAHEHQRFRVPRRGRRLLHRQPRDEGRLPARLRPS